MSLLALLPSTWNLIDASSKLIRDFSLYPSQGLTDVFILGIIYLGVFFLLIALHLFIRSYLITTRYHLRINNVKDYAKEREALSRELPFFSEFNHHIIEIPKRDGSGDVVLRRSVDAAEIFSDERFALGLSSNRIFQALPSILTGLGVLGTFVGLQIGIVGLDLNDLKKLETSIVPLIQGCAVAFSTSVWGVGASLVFSFVEKFLEGSALSRVRKLQQKIDGLIPRFVPEEAMADLASSSRGSEEILKGLAVAIGDEMQKAIRQLGEEVKEAVANATKEGQAPLATMAVELLSSAIAVELDKLKQGIVGVSQRLAEDFNAVSTTLNRQVEELGKTVASVSQSVTTAQEAVENAVSKLNAHESFVSSIAGASEKIKEAADSFVSMNATLETSASLNKQAAEAQNEAAKSNLQVAATFYAIGERLLEVRQTIEDAARVIGSLGEPVADLHTLLAKQPELQLQIEERRAISEQERSTRLLSISNELAQTVGKAVEEFAKVGEIAQILDKASNSLNEASNELAVFGQQVLQASKDQRAASEASKEAATANKFTIEVLKPLPTELLKTTQGLAEAGNSLKEGAVSVAQSYQQLIKLQNLWFDGAKTGLSAMRDQLNEIITAYGSQIEGQTQALMNQWTTQVTECLKSYELQVQTLQEGLDELQDSISKIKNMN